ncbi:MAG: LLM class F420-dependent oxidoreductase [Gammaproteobacteria bacterium]
MKHALTIFPTDYSIQPADLAREAEARGFESLWFPEHSHIPASRASPWPGGAELPKMYYDVYEPFVALAAAAAVTSSIKLATGVCLVVQRDPIQTAKNVATIDRISGGRFLFGIGAGWNAEEMGNHGTAFRQRIAVMRERVEAMKAIWAQPRASYHGRHVNFDEIMAWPKPLQAPHPPIHVGGAFPKAAERAVAYGDGWIPLWGRGDILAEIPRVRQMLAAAGRGAAKFEISIFAAPTDADTLARIRDAGVDRCVFGLPPAGPEKVLPILDKLATLAR